MAIEIQGYKRVSDDNRVYLRDEVITVEGKPIEAQRVILPKRSIWPSADDVINYLQQKATQPAGSKTESPCGHASCATIEELLGSLPDFLLRAIKRKEERFTDAVKACYTEPRAEFVYTVHGLVLPKSVTKAEANLKEEGRNYDACDLYALALADEDMPEGFGLAHYVVIQLSQGMLHPKSEMDVLLKNDTTLSEPLRIKRPRKEKCTELIELLYAALPTAQHVQQLADTSQEELEGAAMNVIGTAVRVMAMERAKSIFSRIAGKGRLPPFSEQ